MKNFSSWKLFFWEGLVKCHCLPSHSGWAKGALLLALGRAREVSSLALSWPSPSRRAKGASLLALPWPFPLERPESCHCSPSFGPSLLEEPGSGNYVREYLFRFRKIKKKLIPGFEHLLSRPTLCSLRHWATNNFVYISKLISLFSQPLPLHAYPPLFPFPHPWTISGLGTNWVLWMSARAARAIFYV